MALEFRTAGKTVRFLYEDGDASTVVALSPEDDEDALVRKLRRVVALMGAEYGPAEVPHERPFVPFVPQRGTPRAPEPAPTLPAHLRGQWDLEEPSGPVGKGWEAMGDDLPAAPGEGA